METKIENIFIYGIVFILCLVVVVIYLRKEKNKSKITDRKIAKAKELGLYEPVSLHPVVDVNSCIQTGACITACPEKDILGISNGKAVLINASRCIGHGACFHACPTEAITLCIGTEKRGVDLPHINQNFETNVPGIYIAGELGGMGLIKNSVEQGRQAVENIVKSVDKKLSADFDLVIVGAGPAGISAALTAKKMNLRAVVFEQETLGGTVFTFPRSKIVMTSAMDLPLYGKVKLSETSKTELLDLWKSVIEKNNIDIKENSKVEAITNENGLFIIELKSGEKCTAQKVLLAIGRRGTPRKLNVPGEMLEKVAYRLVEPEEIHGKNIVVVGGGDAGVESALMLCEQNKVTLLNREDSFGRIKPMNNERLNAAAAKNLVDIRISSNIVSIEPEEVTIYQGSETNTMKLKNDLVFIFAGGELPTQFLEKAGIKITKKFGEAFLKH
jgi:thioredoxin reductase/Pyruvate/2-oxoacid:ferredoxin oxidoreductase delta subunit